MLEQMVKDTDKLQDIVDIKDNDKAAFFTTAMLTLRMHLRAAACTANREIGTPELIADLVKMQEDLRKLKFELELLGLLHKDTSAETK